MASLLFFLSNFACESAEEHEEHEEKNFEHKTKKQNQHRAAQSLVSFWSSPVRPFPTPQSTSDHQVLMCADLHAGRCQQTFLELFRWRFHFCLLWLARRDFTAQHPATFCFILSATFFFGVSLLCSWIVDIRHEIPEKIRPEVREEREAREEKREKRERREKR